MRVLNPIETSAENSSDFPDAAAQARKFGLETHPLPKMPGDDGHRAMAAATVVGSGQRNATGDRPIGNEGRITKRSQLSRLTHPQRA
jgi:hypothetical protein